MDLLIGKSINIDGSFDLRIFAEILNLTDHRDVLYVYGDTGDPNFTFAGNLSDEYMRDPSNFGPPRSIRFGAGIEF
jgi:hypothetical protein